MVLNVFLPFLVLIGDSGATSVPAFFVGETAAFPVVLGSNVLCTVEFCLIGQKDQANLVNFDLILVLLVAQDPSSC